MPLKHADKAFRLLSCSVFCAAVAACVAGAGEASQPESGARADHLVETDTCGLALSAQGPAVAHPGSSTPAKASEVAAGQGWIHAPGIGVASQPAVEAAGYDPVMQYQPRGASPNAGSASGPAAGRPIVYEKALSIRRSVSDIWHSIWRDGFTVDPCNEAQVLGVVENEAPGHGEGFRSVYPSSFEFVLRRCSMPPSYMPREAMAKLCDQGDLFAEVSFSSFTMGNSDIGPGFDAFRTAYMADLAAFDFDAARSELQSAGYAPLEPPSSAAAATGHIPNPYPARFAFFGSAATRQVVLVSSRPIPSDTASSSPPRFAVQRMSVFSPVKGSR